MRLTTKEIRQLKEAVEISKRIETRIRLMVKKAESGGEVKDREIWDLKNESAQIPAVLYNVRYKVYRSSVNEIGGKI